jgi:hypothetical protein
MTKILQLDKTDSPIEPELKDFIDACLVPLLVRDALKKIHVSESDVGLESTASLHVRCANGGTR